MKQYILILQFFLFSYSFAQCTFERFFYYQASDPIKVLPLKDGGYLSYGTFWIDSVLGVETDMILIKTDSCGNTVWINDDGYEGDGDPYKYAIEMDSGNIMIVGYTAADYTARIAKYNKTGELVKEQFLKKNTDGFVNGITKNKQSNTYLVFGRTELTSKPLITEIDENLNIIRRKEFQLNEISSSLNLTWGHIGHLIPFINNHYYCNIGIGSSNKEEGYLVELDSAFAIKKRIVFPMDSLYSFGFYTMYLSTDQKHFDCAGVLQKNMDDPRTQFFLRMDFNAKIERITYLDDTLQYITSMSPTLDGGYIFGPQLLKVDSNLNIQWTKPTRGDIYNVEQLPDGNYICSGSSNTRRKQWGLEPFYEIYLVKMDQNGNYIKTGANEENRQLSNDITVYPNPSNNGLFSIQTTHQSYQTVSIYNTTGQLVYTSTNTSAVVDLSNQANGLYYMTIQNKEGYCVHQQKIQMQR